MFNQMIRSIEIHSCARTHRERPHTMPVHDWRSIAVQSLQHSAAQSTVSVWVSCGCGTTATRVDWSTCVTLATWTRQTHTHQYQPILETSSTLRFTCAKF